MSRPSLKPFAMGQAHSVILFCNIWKINVIPLIFLCFLPSIDVSSRVRFVELLRTHFVNRSSNLYYFIGNDVLARYCDPIHNRSKLIIKSL